MIKLNYSIILSAFLFFSLQLLNAQDWANLNRFKKQNEALGIPLKGEKRVVFMGNSITEGWKFSDPDLFDNNGFINRGIGGQTTPQMLVRFRSDVINLQPEVVVILAGTNDIAGNTGPMTLEEIRDNIASMAELATSNGISVIISSVLPAYDYPWRTGLKPNIKIPELNKMLKDYAEHNGMTYLDYYSAMADDRNGLPNDLAEDGVHPTKKGYEIMKPMVLEAINGVFEKK